MSLRLRLLLAAGMAALVALVIADIATYSALRSTLYGRLDQDLQAALGPLGSGGGSGSSSENNPGVPDFHPGHPPVGGGGAFVATETPSGQLIVYSYGSEPGGRSYTPSLPKDLKVSSNESGRQSVRYFSTGSTTAGGPHFRVAATATADGTIQIVALPLGDTTTTLRQLLYIELAVTGGALVLALAAGWLLVRAGLRPLRQIEDTADAIVAGALDARVPDDDKSTEVGQLARALNVMLGRIQTAFAERDATEAELRASEDRLRRFVADASHELRTPLSAVSAYAELFARGAEQRPEDLPRVMTGIRRETARMAHLVDDLLLLARLDEGRPLKYEPVELVSVVAEAVQAATLVGPAWPARLDAAEPVEILGDALRLRQVVDNLLANVRAHTPEGTGAAVRVSRQGHQAVLAVSDNGPGMSAADASRVFDRFFRADVSRSRATGGTGLGLSIVAAIVDAHGGRVEVDAGEGTGATFTVRLPLAGAR